MATPVDANYVRVRSGLLDALAALGPLREAVALVGAQAVYEYIRDQAGDFAVSPLTVDADLALMPELLAEDPRIIDAMENAGYTLTDQPSIYKRDDGVQVDLLVVTVQTCGDLRAIRLLTEGQPSTEFALEADSVPSNVNSYCWFRRPLGVERAEALSSAFMATARPGRCVGLKGR